MTINPKVAAAFLDLLEASKLKGIREELQRLGHSFAQIMNTTHAEDRRRVDNEAELFKRSGHVASRVDTIERRFESFLETVTARLRALEGTGNGTASPAHINVVELRDAIVQLRGASDTTADVIHALAKRTELLESGRTGVNVNVQRIEVKGDDPDRFATGLVESFRDRVPHAVQRHGPPPGVPHVWIGPNPPIDPTTAAIEKLTRERDEVTEQRNRYMRLEGELANANAGSKANSERAEQLHAERESVKLQRDDLERRLRAVTDEERARCVTIDELKHKLEVSSGALALASKEWDQLRERINPLLPPDLQGQSLVDAVPALIKRLVCDAEAPEDDEDAERYASDRDAFAAAARKATERVGELQAKRLELTRTIADQAKQIAELRGELGNAAAGSTWNADQAVEWHGKYKALCDKLHAETVDNKSLRGAIDTITKARDYALKGCDTLGTQLTLAQRSSKESRDRVVALEEQAQRRDKLEAERLAAFEALQDRIRTVADEKFGPFPVQSADDALSAIEQGVFFQSIDVENGRKLYEHASAWDSSIGNGAAVANMTEGIKAYETERTRVQAMREVGMARFYGPPVSEDDCQAGTCDCPSEGYDIVHRTGEPENKADPGKSGAV